MTSRRWISIAVAIVALSGGAVAQQAAPKLLEPEKKPVKPAPPALISVSKSEWEQTRVDLAVASKRIRELKAELASKQKQLEELKKKPGCGG
jgi:hypothetical protein